MWSPIQRIDDINYMALTPCWYGKQGKGCDTRVIPIWFGTIDKS